MGDTERKLWEMRRQQEVLDVDHHDALEAREHEEADEAWERRIVIKDEAGAVISQGTVVEHVRHADLGSGVVDSVEDKRAQGGTMSVSVRWQDGSSSAFVLELGSSVVRSIRASQDPDEQEQFAKQVHDYAEDVCGMDLSGLRGTSEAVIRSLDPPS